MKILYIITNLSTGGAEIQLLSLIKELCENNDIAVISLLSKGEMGSKIEDLGIPLYVLELNNFTNFPKSINNFRKILHYFKPDVIHTWMYHSNLIGGIIPYFFGFKNIIWSIHHNSFTFKHNRFTTVILIRFSAILSYFIPQKIVCVSNEVMIKHQKILYNPKRLCYIPNGINPNIFFQSKKNSFLYNRFDINSNTKLIGFISRFDPIKNHQFFFNAIKIIKTRNYFNLKIVLCGKNIDNNNDELLRLIHHYKLQDDVVLLGLFTNMQLLYSSLDLIVCTSYSESFSIVLAEAISCGRLCVSTVSGDPENLLSNTQHINDASNAEEIANVILDNLNLNLEKKSILIDELRLNLINKYSINIISCVYLELYKQYYNER
jgi:glycosyltransferase involved in cell wall biosynthesis